MDAAADADRELLDGIVEGVKGAIREAVGQGMTDVDGVVASVSSLHGREWESAVSFHAFDGDERRLGGRKTKPNAFLPWSGATPPHVVGKFPGLSEALRSRILALGVDECCVGVEPVPYISEQKNGFLGDKVLGRGKTSWERQKRRGTWKPAVRIRVRWS